MTNKKNLIANYMQLTNTYSGQKENFKTLHQGVVNFYSCGPTVYDTAHIGNLRTYIFNDLLKRSLILAGFQVKHVMNITDVDDKTIKKSGGDRKKFEELTKECEALFWRDLESLNIIKPDVVTRATAYIPQMVDFVTDLLDKGYAYRGEDGSIYFSIAKFPDYGKLSKLDKEGIQAGARVAHDEYDKENPADFVLWKAWDEDDGEVFWETALGKGRPGWHIECSAMSTSILGPTLDIHTGGVDNIFPHHENEIAQSEARTGKKFVNFWVHGEHLLVDEKKMSKSAGNFYKLQDVVEKGFSPLDFRFLVLGAHYRSKLNFTWDALEGARNARVRLMRIIEELKSGEQKVGGGKSTDPVLTGGTYLNDFNNKIIDDLDTPGAFAVLWSMVRDSEMEGSAKYAALLQMDNVLGLRLGGTTIESIPEAVVALAERRELARRDKDFSQADKLRAEIEADGWIVEDTSSGYKLTKK